MWLIYLLKGPTFRFQLIAMVLLQISVGILLTGLLMALIVALTGLLLPKRIAYQQAHSFFVPEITLRNLLLTQEKYPEWRPGVQAVTILQPAYNEWEECYGNNHCITYRAQVKPDQQQIYQYAIKNSSPFTVNRTYTIWEQDHMAFIKIEDELLIASPYLRALAFLFYNHQRFLQREIKRFALFSSKAA